MALKIGEDQAVQMPMKTVISLIVIVALGTMGYFQIVERLNVADTKIQIMEKDKKDAHKILKQWTERTRPKKESRVGPEKLNERAVSTKELFKRLKISGAI